MESIILTKEQIDAANHNQAGAFAVKGIAGSGKTTVGLNRIPYLKKTCFNDENILVVTYQKVLTDYLKHLNSKMSDGSQFLFDFNQTENVEIVNVDKLIYEKYKDYRKRFSKHKFYKDMPASSSNPKALWEVFYLALNSIRRNYPDLEILEKEHANFLKDEVDYINHCRIDSLKQYQIFTRKGRNRFEDNRRNLAKKSRVREAIFQLRKQYNNELIISGNMDFPVMRLLALREVINNPPKQYTHIIIDECQDMDKARMDFLKHFLTDEKSSSATFLYDNTQSIYSESWLGSGHGFNTLGIDIKGKSKILKKNFRTTYEIQEAAQSLLNNHQLVKQEVVPILINKSGIKPFWALCNDYEHQLKYIVDVIKTHTKNLNLNDIIVAARTNREAEMIHNDLNNNEIDSCLVKANNNSFAHNQVRIMTLNSSKGLESKMVILANLNQGSIPINCDNDLKLAQELKLLYVGMTRASQFLYLTSYGQPSSFIRSISANTVQKVDFNHFKWFEELEDPQLKRRIQDLIIRLEDSIHKFISIGQKAKELPSFISQSKQMMQEQHKMEQIHVELHLLEDEIPANSSLHDLFNSFHKTCENKMELAHHEFINFIQSPVKFDEILNEINNQFKYFNSESINTIATVEFHIQRKESLEQDDQSDWGPFLTSYSKALELEFDKLFEKYGMSLFSPFRKDRNGNPSTLSLHEKMRELKKRKDKLSDITMMLDLVNFRKERNDATHSKVLLGNEILAIRKMMMQENGVFSHLNNLLA
ncbi:3'-5' exonuclease [Carboxylicivirga sp. N1Y90]|uniref:3'-5' exonuclease n=1 Tax=Carboxylicivirga fragile TaxID=3417571 RepID=UPI003D3336D4|nr:UvrD-helicase domain-containing protein [Marinilabiliaceae bacterium N1Y90]